MLREPDGVDEATWAWLAGLLEGEGSFMRGPPSAPGTPIISVHMTDEDVVRHVAFLFGGNSVRRIVPQKSHHKVSFATRVGGRRAVELMTQLRPWMSERRREQIDRAVASWSGGRQILDVADVLARHAGGESAISIAAIYGVTREAVHRAIRLHRNAKP